MTFQQTRRMIVGKLKARRALSFCWWLRELGEETRYDEESDSVFSTFKLPKPVEHINVATAMIQDGAHLVDNDNRAN